jgi:hypothetical protein
MVRSTTGIIGGKEGEGLFRVLREKQKKGKSDEFERGRMTRYRKRNLQGLAVILFLLVHGCGDYTFYAHIDQGRVSGAWDLSLVQSDVSVRDTKLSITQEKRYDPFFGTTSDSATLTGSFDGNNVVIVLNNADGTTTTLTGSARNDWKTLSGAYTSTGSNGSGTWWASREVAPTPTPTPVPPVSVAPSAAILSCSAGQFATFVVTGGTLASYSVTASSNGSLVFISTATLTTSGQFTVTAATACAGINGTIVNLTITDSASSVTVPVTITNP